MLLFAYISLISLTSMTMFAFQKMGQCLNQRIKLKGYLKQEINMPSQGGFLAWKVRVFCSSLRATSESGFDAYTTKNWRDFDIIVD